MESIDDYLGEAQRKVEEQDKRKAQGLTRAEVALTTFRPVGKRLFEEAVSRGLVPTPGSNGPHFRIEWSDGDTSRYITLTSDGLLSDHLGFKDQASELAQGLHGGSRLDYHADPPAIVNDPLHQFGLGSAKAPVAEILARALAEKIAHTGTEKIPPEILEHVSRKMSDEEQTAEVTRMHDRAIRDFAPQGRRMFQELLQLGYHPQKKSYGRAFETKSPSDQGIPRGNPFVALLEDGRLLCISSAGHVHRSMYLPRVFFVFHSGDVEKRYPLRAAPGLIRECFFSESADYWYKHLAKMESRPSRPLRSSGRPDFVQADAVTSGQRPVSGGLSEKLRRWFS